MPFKIPNVADASVAAQAQVDSVDFEIIDAGSGRTGVISGCGVTVNSGMVLNVASGTGRSNGNVISVVAGTVTIATAHATLDRFDMVVADYPGTVSVVAGTAAAAPVFPIAASPATTSGRVVLAAVRVPAAASSIVSANIVDKRATLQQNVIESFVNGPFVGGRYRYGISAGSGIQSRSSGQLDTEFADYLLAGVQWLRCDAVWSNIETPSQGTFVWTEPDLLVSRAALKGLKILFVIDATPTWAQIPSIGTIWSPPNDLAATSAGSAAYNSFITQLVNRYKPGNATAGLNGGSVSHWEVWNEPNIQSFWHDTVANPWPNPVRYGHLLQGAYTTIKAADPNATVISAGLAPASNYASLAGVNGTNTTNVSPERFLEYLYADGIKGSMDAVGWHAYELTEGATNTLIADFGGPTLRSQNLDFNAWWQMYGPTHSARKQMIANGDGGKPIWITETGGYSLASTGTGSALVNEQQIVDQILSDMDAHADYEWAGPYFYHAYGTYEDVNFGMVDTTAGVRRARFWAYADRANRFGSS